MEQKAIDLLLDKVKDQFETANTKTTLELKEMKDTFMAEAVKEFGKNSEHVQLMQKQLDTLSTDLKKQREKSLNPEPKTMLGILKKGLKDEKFSKQVEDGNVNFILKTISNSSMTAGDNEVNLPMRELGIDKAQVRPAHVSQIIQWGTTSSLTVDWVERTSKTDAAAIRAEGAAMAEGALGYTERSVKAKIVSELMKATKESLKDTDFLASEINTELISDVMLALDAQLLSGDGVGNNIKGVLEYAQAFAAGAFATAVQAPNEADVIRVALNQIVLAGKGKYLPDYILMNPTDVATIDLTKSTTDNYIKVPFVSNGVDAVKNVRILENTGMTAGTYVIGDFKRAKAFLRDSLEIKIWDQNQDDAEKNLATITGNIRVAFRIKNQDAYAFVKGTFATDITAITKP